MPIKLAMMRSGLTLCLLSIVFTSKGQRISNIDYDEIKSNIQDSTSVYYYPTLSNRFNSGDTTLTIEQKQHFYYGYVFDSAYSPYGKSASQLAFEQAYREGDFKKAFDIGKTALDSIPTDVELTFAMLVCASELEKESAIERYRARYFALLDAIFSSGDGTTIETAFVVNRVSDEYEILDVLGLKRTEQALLSSGTNFIDMMKISKKGQPKGQKKIKEVYFNITKCFEALSKMLREEEDD